MTGCAAMPSGSLSSSLQHEVDGALMTVFTRFVDARAAGRLKEPKNWGGLPGRRGDQRLPGHREDRPGERSPDAPRR
jgi:hypothetical protein